MLKLSAKGILTHAFFVSLFLIVPTIAFIRPPNEPFFPMSRVFLQDTIANFVMLGFFYLNYYTLIPKLFFPQKYFVYTLCVIGFITITLTLPNLLARNVPHVTNYLPPEQKERVERMFREEENNSVLFFMWLEFRHHLSLFFSAIFFSFLLKTRQHLSEIKEEKLKAELSSLKSQINPHFLFNTLNSIYALSVKKDDRASDAIINLSGLMRYIIKDSNDYKIPLHKEIEYMENYIELQKARLGNTANVRFKCWCDPGDKKIAPLILITYIENAFNYGVNPDVENCIVDIELEVTETGIRLKTFNKKAQSNAKADSSGIGMQNTRKRLQLLYPDKHLLDITENEETYSLTLLLTLK
jgi:LytS/YehU family sensor histidine kinase